MWIKIKVVFLDIDGVLNSERFFKERNNKGVDLDESRFPLLKEIVESTNSKIVLSSSWRNLRGCDQYNQLPVMLSKYGMEIYDYTPYLGAERGKEIAQWIADNIDCNLEKFIILDDDSFDMGEYVNHELVHTSWYDGYGLEQKHVEESISKLR